MDLPLEFEVVLVVIGDGLDLLSGVPATGGGLVGQFFIWLEEFGL